MSCFDLPPPTHWLVDGAVACGAALTPRQHELRTTEDGMDGQWRRYVTCPKCIKAIRRRIRQLADPSTEAEEAYARVLERLYWVRER